MRLDLSGSRTGKKLIMALDDIAIINDDPEEEEAEEEEEEEEELQDPLDSLKVECGNSKHCASLSEKYNECNDRVSSRTRTEETCSEELFDYLHCIDHCLTNSLFQKLK
ncbi:cytochrome b-c1 complex subunit 6, mitochondrial-like [Palaemon carinicauda]|uniref:cytochrome b-c1 complex subunit 6, mitochondrial-like n=1 Tax=Palaemon carinicauda TaxID=392227 RepID=UPI0035B68C7C